MIEKYYKRIKQIFKNYKKNLAKLMRTGKIKEVVALLNDSGFIDSKDKSMIEIARKSLTASSIEELEIQKVNFAFSLLFKQEKEVIINEFFLDQHAMWWVERYSRSTYYRLRQTACSKFIEYYEGK